MMGKIITPDAIDEAGWTLIELLVGLVLLSLITVLITSSVYSSRRSLAQVERRDEAMSIEMAETYLRHALAEAQPIKAANAPIDAPLIDAGRDHLRLVTAYAPAGQFGGLYEIGLGLAENRRRTAYDLAETRTLYRPTPEPGMPEPLRPSDRSHLIPRVAALGLRYYGVRGEDETATWGDEWSDPTKLPDLIEIQLRFPNGDNRRWTPLIVALPVGR
jgi:general secretion pathway protein J